MKLFKMFFRDEAEMSVDVFETWEVRWDSRHGSYSSDTRPEVRSFPVREDANAFAKALKDAFNLIKHTSGRCISVSKVKQ